MILSFKKEVMKIRNSIIICTYNEVGNIKLAIKDLQNYVPNSEIILVDDNSTDGTQEEILEINKSQNIKVIIRKKIKGLGSAFQRGLIETDGEYIGWIDTNMTYLASKFSEMSKLLDDGNDIVILSRYIKDGSDERPNLRALTSRYLNIFCRLIFRSKIKDFTSGIFLMKRKLLDDVSVLGYGHGDFFIEFLYNIEKKGFKVKEYPYIQKKDLQPIKSKSAPNLFKFTYYGVKYIMRIFITLLRKN